MNKTLAHIVALLAVAACVRIASAQTGPQMLFDPWEAGKSLALAGSYSIFDSGHVKGGNEDFDQSIGTASGRFRFDKSIPVGGPTVGFDAVYYDVDSSRSRFSEDLLDVNLAVGSVLVKPDPWFVALIVGVGYGGSTPLSDSDAVYFLGNVAVGRQLDQRSSIVFFLDYDGNRSIFPDVPVPAFAYTYRVDEKLSLVLGFPFSMATWKPLEQLTIEATVSVPDNVEATATWAFTEHFKVYAALRGRTDSFHIEGDDKNRRVFFRQRMAEVGLRFDPAPGVALKVAGGYGFGGEWTRGFDARSQSGLFDISDEPYLNVGFELRL